MKNTKKRSSQFSHPEKMQIYNEFQRHIEPMKVVADKFNITTYTLKSIVQEIEELIRYKIYGEPPKQPKVCNICGGKVKFNRCDTFKSKSGFVYYCTKCHSWVGTSPRKPKEALGELGNKETRLKRQELHRWFDKLWRNHSDREYYYDRLAKELGKSECHFSQMTMEELNRALDIVKKWWFEKYDK